MKFNTKNIKDVAIFLKTGKTPPTKISRYFNGSVNWYTPTDLDDKTFLDLSTRFISQAAIEDKKAIVFPERTVLISCIGEIGKLGITTSVESSSNQQITGILLNEEEVVSEYFFYWCKAHKRILARKASNAVVPILNNKRLGKIKIHFPSQITDQIRIATLLSRAEELITKRKESIRLLDELLKSTFLEMFGNPAKNEKEWSKHKASTFIDNIVSGTSYKGEVKEILESDELGVLKVSAVTWGRFNPLEFKAVKKDKIKKTVVTVKNGDFLFSRANTKELVAASCIVDDDYPELFLPDKLWRIDLNEDVCNRFYFNYLLKINDFRNILTRQATGTSGSMLNISMKKLRNTNIPVPPLPLQNKFAEICKKVESLLTKYETSLQELENLYGSLSQRAFRGELDVSKVPTHHATQHHTSYVRVDVPRKVVWKMTQLYEVSLKTLIHLIRNKLPTEFTFDELQNVLVKTNFDSKPEYQMLKNVLLECLEGKSSFLLQKFGHPVSTNNDRDKQDKQIFFSVNQ